MGRTGTFVAILNPAAGGGRCGMRAAAAIDGLRDAGLTVEVRETAAAGDGVRLTREAYAAGYRDFIAVGGDGTSFEVVNGLFPEALHSERKPSLGFLPLGTGNSFLRDFSEDGAQLAHQALLDGRSRSCDVVRLTHRDGELFYINILSLGFVADVCTVANRRFKRFGEAAYGMGVIVKLAQLTSRPFVMRYDGGEQDRDPAVFVSINNSRFTGGKMMMAPDADPGDGEVDVVFAGNLGRWSLLRTFPKIFAGTHVQHPLVRTHRARHIDFELTGPTDAMVDGEVISLWPERLDVLPSALEVHV